MDESTHRDEPERAIAATKAAFADAVRQGDIQAASAVYADAARLVAPSAQLIEGRSAIRAFWQAGLDSGVTDVELEAVEVQPQKRMAYEIGRYALRLRPTAEETVVDRGTYVLVLEQQADGSWRRVFEMFSPDAAAVTTARPAPGE